MNKILVLDNVRENLIAIKDTLEDLIPDCLVLTAQSGKEGLKGAFWTPLYMMDIELIDKIFEPYSSTKKNLIETGLGLYMSKMLVEKNMKGSLTMQNTEKGAAFTIEITIS